MQCKGCGNYDNRVIDSELRIRDNCRIRLRICTHCGAKLPTIEKIDVKKFKKLNPKKRYSHE